MEEILIGVVYKKKEVLLVDEAFPQGYKGSHGQLSQQNELIHMIQMKTNMLTIPHQFIGDYVAGEKPAERKLSYWTCMYISEDPSKPTKSCTWLDKDKALHLIPTPLQESYEKIFHNL